MSTTSIRRAKFLADLVWWVALFAITLGFLANVLGLGPAGRLLDGETIGDETLNVELDLDQVDLEEAGILLVVGHAAATGLRGALGLAVVYLIRESLGAALAGNQPFRADNHRRIRFVGWLVLAQIPTTWLIDTLEAFAETRSVDVKLGISPGPLLLGLLVFAIAEVYAAGVELAEEQELTI